MDHTVRQTKSRRLRRMGLLAFSLAAVSCVFGLFFCLVKSPQARADAYVAMAVDSLDSGENDRAAQAALTALRLDPLQAGGWHVLAATLQHNGDDTGAARARAIADRVAHNPNKAVLPVYAVPAEFRLSLLTTPAPSTP